MSGSVFAAGALGLLGSLHCAAMCGPLAFAGCTRNGAVDRRDAWGYAFARSLGYATLGAAAGHAGARLALSEAFSALATPLLLSVAVFALVRGLRALVPSLLPSAFRPRGAVPASALGRSRRRRLSWLAPLLPRRGAALGLATAFLPCGLLAGALALAAAAGDARSGALTLAVFSLATLPALALPFAARPWLARFAAAPALTGLAWIALAAWLSMRPLLTSTTACP